ncbi:hypothetical protein [Ferruginibacter profundus]
MNKFTGYKKSILVSIGFLFLIPWLKAQEPAYARQLFKQNSLVAAKESVDSFLQQNSSSAEAWLLKAQVYNAITSDLFLKDLVADGRMDALQALQKAMQLNKPYTEKELSADNYKLAFELYNGYNDEAVAYFNAGAERNDKASYAAALTRFKKAAAVMQFIAAHIWVESPDVRNLLYSAKAAIAAGKEDDAMYFAKKMADQHISGYPYGDGEPVYKWFLYHLRLKKDDEGMHKYYGTMELLYPSSDYYMLNLIDYYRDKNDIVAMIVQYYKLFSTNAHYGKPVNRLLLIKDLYNYLYTSPEKNPPFIDARDHNWGIVTAKRLKDTLYSELVRFYKTADTVAEAKLLLGKFYINQAVDNEKAGKKTAAANNLKQSNIYLQELVNQQPAVKDKKMYKEALALLLTNYKILGMPKEMKKYAALQKRAGK